MNNFFIRFLFIYFLLIFLITFLYIFSPIQQFPKFIIINILFIEILSRRRSNFILKSLKFRRVREIHI